MKNDLLNEIIASGVDQKDAENAVGLAQMVSKIDQLVYSSSCPIKFTKKKSSERILKFNSSNNSYLIHISGINRRINRIEFSFFINNSKMISKKEKFMTLAANEIRSELQKSEVRLFTPNFSFKKHALRKILERLTLIEGYGLNKNMLIYDKKRFDAQLITLICLYYYRRKTSLSNISKILTWQPK